MKKIPKLLLTLLMLAVIAAASGLFIGCDKQLTDPNDEEKLRNVENALTEIYPISQTAAVDFTTSNASLKAYIDGFYSAKNSEEANVYIVVARGTGYKPNLQMYIVIKDDMIIALKEGTNDETPSVASTAFVPDLFDQFLNKDLNSITDFVINGSGDNGIDAVSYATKTSIGVVNAVNNGIKLYQEYNMIYPVNITQVLFQAESEDNEFESQDNVLMERIYNFAIAKNSNEEDVYVVVSESATTNRGQFVRLKLVIKDNNIISMKDVANGEYNREEKNYRDDTLNQSYYVNYLQRDIDSVYPFVVSTTETAGNVDAESGATSTSKRVAEAVNNGLKIYLEYRDR